MVKLSRMHEPQIFGNKDHVEHAWGWSQWRTQGGAKWAIPPKFLEVFIRIIWFNEKIENVELMWV
jgi:hypothetical protein